MNTGRAKHSFQSAASRVVLTLCLGLSAPPPARAAEGELGASGGSSGDRPILRVARLAPDFRLDGRMGEGAWTSVTDSIADITMLEPEEGGVPTSPTIVKVLADDRSIVIGIQCRDAEPGKISAFSKARDSDLTEEDHVIIVLDPFLDGRSGYVFSVNPAGARFDGLVASRGEEANPSWDASWEAVTSRDEKGWCAEIRIPISSLAFKKNATSWGFNLQRRVQRLQEVGRWSGANLDFEIYQTSKAGLLTNLPAFDLGVGMSIRPATVGVARKPGPRKSVETTEEFSFDATQRIGPHLLSSLTVNTDFSETEVDVRTINLSRFPVLFPEKRTFFLSGADVFEFGLGLDEDNLVPFYSRRIGLFGPEEDDLSIVPIDIGGKINGRLGNTSIGALVANTKNKTVPSVGVFDQDTTVNLPYARMGALRLRQDILAESAFGILATFGDQLDRKDAWSGGTDFTYQTSSFQGDKNLLFGAWGMRSDREKLRGDKYAYGARFEYPNDLIDANVAVTRIGDGFDPSMGFVPRKGVQIFQTGVEFLPRPGWPWLRQSVHELAYTQYQNRRSDRWESYSATVRPLDLLFESGDRFEIRFEPEGDRLERQFEVYPDIDIAPGSYEWSRHIFTAVAAAKRLVSGELRFEGGGYYTGWLETVAGRLTLKPSSLATLELTAEKTASTVLAPENESVELFVKRFKQQLLGCRVELNVSPDLQLGSLTQYDSESRELSSNTRVRWTFHPDGDVFLVYNHNEIRPLGHDFFTLRRWQFASSQAPIKVQFAWRF